MKYDLEKQIMMISIKMNIYTVKQSEKSIRGAYANFFWVSSQS